MYLIYINPLNKDFKGQNTYEFIFTKRIDNVEYGEDWDVQPASSGSPTPPNIEQVEMVGVLKSEDIELSLAMHSDTFSMYDCVEGIISLGWETESQKLRKDWFLDTVKQWIRLRKKFIVGINYSQ